MKKEITIVPKGMCPLDVIAGLGERTKKAWIFFDQTSAKQLKSNADIHRVYQHNAPGAQEFHWHETQTIPETAVLMEYNPEKSWLETYSIVADDIAFTRPADDPDEIFFLKMEE